jgi:hypothetical protein
MLRTHVLRDGLFQVSELTRFRPPRENSAVNVFGRIPTGASNHHAIAIFFPLEN